MKQSLIHNAHELQYTLRTSTRARRLRVTVKNDATCTVTMPRRMSVQRVEQFLKEKFSWILKAVEHYKKSTAQCISKNTRAEYMAYKEAARTLAHERIAYFNSFYHFSYRTISVKNQQTRWGSCSKQGNLNFNYRIALLPTHLADYVIVHELCHLQQLNHSKKFWALVEKTLPNWRLLRRELKSLRIS